MNADFPGASLTRCGLCVVGLLATLLPMRLHAHCNLSYAATNAPVCVGEVVVIEQTGRDCAGNTDTVYHQFSYSSPQVVTNCPDCTGCEAITNITHCAIFSVVGIARVETNDVLACPGIVTNFTAVALPAGAGFPSGKPLWRVEPTNAGSVTPATGATTTFTGDTNYVGVASVIAECCTSSATSTVSTLVVDLDIDSDNNNGTASLPDRSTTEEDAELTGNGKFVFVNHNDDDNDEIPDFADKQVTGEGNLVPIIVSVSQALDWAQATLQFDYSGPTAVDLVNTPGQDLGHGYTNYHVQATLKNGMIRIWNIASPGEERTSAKYIVPGTAYTAQTLSFTGTKTFYVEGVNAGVGNITVTLGPTGCADAVKVTVVEPNLGVNCGSSAPGLMRAGTPDAVFEISSRDEALEDQLGGFKFWWARDGGLTTSPLGIVDLAPLMVSVPQSLIAAGFKFYIGVTDGNLLVVNVRSPATNRRQFLENMATANDQLAEIGFWVLHDFPPVEIAFTSLTSREFLFRSVGTGISQRKILLLVKEPTGDVSVIADSCVITFKETRDYWQKVSTRFNTIGGFSYPTEDARAFIGDRYPNAVAQSGSLDPARRRHLVFVHGYWVSGSQAEIANDEYYRRLYWLGYRGNYIGLVWEGDETSLIPGVPPLFDPNVKNAFQTAESLRRLLNEVRADVGASKIDVMAHSLGNLVCWEALRLHRASTTGKLCNKLISVEAAVWNECFDQQQPLTYYPPSVPVTYSVNDLKQHSWSFWFRQTGQSAIGALQGNRAYSSFLPDDTALYYAMRLNDYLFRAVAVDPNHPTQSKWWHYHRDRLLWSPPQYRQQFDGKSLSATIPGHMVDRKPPYYEFWKIRLPLGAEPELHPQISSVPAALSGWPAGQHSAFRDLPYPRVNKWYRDFLITRVGLAIEEEF